MIGVLLFAGNEAHKVTHNWEATTPRIQAALERDPRISVNVSLDIEDLSRRNLGEYAVILLNYCNWHDPTPLSQASRTAFLEFLHAGGGLVVPHFSNGAFHFSLPKAGESDWPEYRKIVRRVWNHFGEKGARSSHDPFGPFTVHITAVRHPITDGLASFDAVDELYFNQAGD